ncbi:two-component system, OmpR family, response regulator RegX3 [Anaerocolumna jejuensis DSM 15929]|uniref:Stage 0 sporulation protein A homolog n=1 Tax=Anaerocolumna jejuensis DSM 15929 TaxID=1121322 RepID=A0A1M6M7I3_9FIRM|nr:response regulator transcription factor [Anaerocolumna jejuensis]SHJ79407.1 two-component system, OmpR family, response regulator RegX3 [Anaerocolumna jejuensis DSM 15929]
MKYDCLVIDDELDIAKTTAEYFDMFGIKTAYATEYEEGMKVFNENEVSLLILDINLKEHSGFKFCKSIREESDIPILFISARDSEGDILTGFNIGGDDYIVKPFTLNILLAKARTMLKRYQTYIRKEEPVVSPVPGHITIDYNYRQVSVVGEIVKLKNQEFRLLAYLVENCNRVISKEELFEKVWEDAYVSDVTLNVHIRRIREKIEQDPKNPRYIKTIWGVGYVFEVKV